MGSFDAARCVTTCGSSVTCIINPGRRANTLVDGRDCFIFFFHLLSFWACTWSGWSTSFIGRPPGPDAQENRAKFKPLLFRFALGHPLSVGGRVAPPSTSLVTAWLCVAALATQSNSRRLAAYAVIAAWVNWVDHRWIKALVNAWANNHTKSVVS